MTTTETQDEASQISRSYARRLDEIRRDPNLTEESKRRRMAEALVAAKTRMSKVRADEREARDKEIGSLKEDLLDPRRSPTVGAHVDSITVSTSYRDALARAAATEGSGLITALDRATAVGDDLQARACLTIALERQDLHAINRYADTHPGTEPKLQRLIDLNGGLNGRNTGTRSMQRAMETAIIAPPELNGMADYQLNELIKSGG